MAEGGGLLNRYTLSRRIEGSNPSVSANGRFSDFCAFAALDRELLRFRPGIAPFRPADPTADEASEMPALFSINISIVSDL